MNLKQFAQQARNILLNGVTQKLHYWGFETNNTITNQPQAIPGGYTFRGNIYDNPNVVALWNELKKAINQNGFETVAEEAAYTWFNRIIALHILAKNNYEQNLLDNAPGMFHTPIILQKARQGHYPYLNKNEQAKLLLILNDYSKDEEIFSQLFIAYCRKHPLIQNIFGQPNDYTELLLPNNMLLDTGFLHLINTAQIPDQQYQQAELIGWLYQFYISEKKDQVFANFKKGKKAEAKDIPAATQIFTPNWIVKYLTQNTIGKLWLDMHPNSPLKQQLNYYINTQQQNQPIVTQVAEIKVLDPACGSGHILVEAFDLLYQMYMLEYYTPDEAIESILQNNLFGLDLDKRATQLASFAILLKAAKYYPQILTKGIYPQIYPMPEPKNFNAHDITLFLQPNNLQYHPILQQTLHLCQNAHNIGSVLKLNANPKAHQCFKQQLQHLQNKPNKDIEEQALLNNLQPYLNVILLLTQKYEAVVANPPYMGQSNMNSTLKNYINEHYPISKSDLFAVFMEVALNLTEKNGFMAAINQHAWMFLSSYEKLREHLIKHYSIVSMLHLGPRVFEELSGEVVQSTAFVMQNAPNNTNATYYRLVDYKQPNEKEQNFLAHNNAYPNVPQSNFSKITGSPIAYWVSDKVIDLFENEISLSNEVAVKGGLSTSDNEQFLRLWFEVSMPDIGLNQPNLTIASNTNFKWFPFQKGGKYRKWYGNFDYVVNWANNGEAIKQHVVSNPKDPNTTHWSRRIFNTEYFFFEGLTWSTIGSEDLLVRYMPVGTIISNAAGGIFKSANSSEYFLYYLGYLNSAVVNYLLNVLNPTINFSSGVIAKIPVKKNKTETVVVADIVTQIINIAKQDWDSREVSWDFEQMPLLSYTGNNIAQSYAAWHQAVSHRFFALHTHEETLNRLFIAIYGLQAELTPTIALSDISILQDELDTKALEKQEAAYRLQPHPTPLLPIKAAVVVQQFVLYGIGIAMGRYRLGKPGLHIAHQNPTATQLQPYHYGQHTLNPDPDGIIPLMGTNGAFPDDALHQIYALLDAIWGDDSRTQNLNFIQAALYKDLEKYLVKDFWKNHCSIYKKKPIYWLFSSSKGAFQVLVYMHRINAFTLEKIRANYLFPHLKNLAAQINRLEANSTLQGKDLDRLRKDLDECQQYDLLLKPKADAQINLDLDQGVSANYALFEGVVAKIV